MDYNYHFALGSVLFMGLTAGFYLMQERMRDLQDRLYTVMLVGGLVAVLFDFAAAAVEPYALAIPRWLLYAANSLFILGEQICLPAFFLFSVAASERYGRMGKTARALSLLPFGVIVLLLMLSPFGTSGIFYIDAQHIYRQGATHFMLYVVAGLYLAGSSVLLLRYYNVVARTKRAFILLLVGLILCAILIQIKNPRLLLATSATALALTAMYYLLRAPGEQVDPLTGAFCRPMLAAMLHSRREQSKRCTLVLYSIQNLDWIVRMHGSQLSDGLLSSMAGYLRAAFPKGVVVYMNDAEFAVVVDGVLDDAALYAIGDEAPSALWVERNEIPVTIVLTALVHRSESMPETTLNTMDFLFRRMTVGQQRERMYIADAAFEAESSRLARLEASMGDLVQQGATGLMTEPVRYADASREDAPAVLDVSLYLTHPDLKTVSPDELLIAIKQSGKIRWYYEQLIAHIAAAARETDPTVRFCLPLFAAVLMQDDTALLLFDLIADAGLTPRRIVLRLSENDVSHDLPAVDDTIRRLAAFGFGFRLVGFADGYTDVSLLHTLPVSEVMIDESLLNNACDSERCLALLGCVVDVLTEIGKDVICAGVDTPEAAAAARAAGAPLLHGRWCCA